MAAPQPPFPRLATIYAHVLRWRWRLAALMFGLAITGGVLAVTGARTAGSALAVVAGIACVLLAGGFPPPPDGGGTSTFGSHGG
jgi:hypothetical protein